MAGCNLRLTPLRVGAGPWTGSLGLRLAAQQLQAEAGELVMLDLPNASSVLTAMRNGLLDVAALTLDEVLLLLGSGHALQVVHVLDVSVGGHALIGAPGVKSLYELPGLRVGVETEALGAYVITRVLALAGIAAERVDIVTLTADQHESALLQGRVHAVLTYEPIRQRLLAHGAVELFGSHQIPGEVVDVLVVRQAALAERDTTLDRLIQASLHWSQRLHDDPAVAPAHLGARAGLSGAALNAAVASIEFPNLAADQALLSAGGNGLQVRAAEMLALMKSRGLTAPDVELPPDLIGGHMLLGERV